MKTLPTIAATILAAFLILSPVMAIAATSYTLSVSTDKSSYSTGGAGTITFTVTPTPGSGTSVGLTITNPNGAEVFTDSAIVSATGSATDTFTTGGSSNWISGTYTVTATWAPTVTSTPQTATTTFAFTCTSGCSVSTPTSSVSLELQATAPSLVYAGQTVQVFALAFWSNGTLAANANFTGSHYHNPSGAVTVLPAPTSVGPGMYEWSWALPATAADGLYAVHLKADVGGTIMWAQAGFTVNSQVASASGLAAIATAVSGLSGLGKNITSISAALTTISNNVNSMNTAIGSLSSTLGTINTNVQGLGTSLTTLSNTVNTISSSIGSITSSITTLTNDVTQMQTTIGSLSGLAGDMSSLQGSVNSLSTSVSNEQTYILVVAALAVITLVLELAILIRKMS